MIVRSYTGRNVNEALERVRADLGEDALIIETRSVKESGLLGRKVGVEIIAGSDSSYPKKATKGVETVVADQARSLEEARPQLVSEDTIKDLMTPKPGLSFELASIRRQLARLASGQGVPTDHLGPALSSGLEEIELPEEVIAECDEAAGRARGRITEDRLDTFLSLFLAKHLDCPGAIDWDQCRNLLVVGPTGVGKTTTIAKLAGDLVLKGRRKVGLVTIDTYRVGAADQLQAYADLLDMPFAVARTPAQLGEILESMADCDNILIDTAGRNPGDETKLHQLRGFCRAAPGLRVMLTISATCGRAEFARVVERFSILPIEHTVITKVDESAAPGRLYGCLRRHGLPVNYLTTGQEVPDDIEAADGQVIGKRVLESARTCAVPVGADH